MLRIQEILERQLRIDLQKSCATIISNINDKRCGYFEIGRSTATSSSNANRLLCGKGKSQKTKNE